MLNKKFCNGALALVLGLALAGAAHASIIFDAQTGNGFVGKGDVQYTFGWNNKDLQDKAVNVEFQAVSTVVTEVSWTCTNNNNDNIQERTRTTTTSIAGLVDSIAREKNQITGFNLTGYNGSPTQTSTTDGPQINSCPSSWSLTIPAGDPTVVSTASTLNVSPDGGATFTLLLEKP